VRLSAEQLQLSYLANVGIENTDFRIRDIWNARPLLAEAKGYAFEMAGNGVIFAYYEGGGRKF
jgi:hypothetical protein